MAMYTRCPACRSEISFEPPANIAGLPEDYKHRIKCPSCGVTIGVKLNTIERQPTRDSYVAIQPVRQAPVPEPATIQDKKNNRNKKDGKIMTKHGRGRNAMMLIFSLLFIALNIVGYLATKGVITVENNSTLFGLTNFNGILVFEVLIHNAAFLNALFEESIIAGVVFILPAMLFVFAIVNFLVSLIALIGGRYSRAFNVIWSLLMLAIGVALIFYNFLFANSDGLGVAEYFAQQLGENMEYAIFAGAGLGLLQTIFAFIFLAPFKYEK